MRSAFRAVLLLALATLVAPGCASVLARSLRPDDAPYVGARSGWEEVTGPNRQVSERAFFALDLPFSAVLDTVLLPWDLLAMPDNDPEEEPEAE